MAGVVGVAAAVSMPAGGILGVAAGIPGQDQQVASPPDRSIMAAEGVAMSAHCAGSPASPPPRRNRRAMWVWTTNAVLHDGREARRLLNSAAGLGATNIYLFLTAQDYVRLHGSLRAFIALASSCGVRVWGLDGWRGYFFDAAGPGDLFEAADRLIAYNARVSPEERFIGFHSDLEPHDGQGVGDPLFHNGLPDSALTDGQAAERIRLLRNWIDLHADLSRRMRAADLSYGAALPSWLDDYYGEAVHVPAEERRIPVMHYLMPLIDQYVVMSYNTNPQIVIAKAAGELAYADRLPIGRRPTVLAAVETHRGVGERVSYGDHPLKGNRRTVLADIRAAVDGLSNYQSFGGIAIHDWQGWRDLPPEPTDEPGRRVGEGAAAP